MKEQLIQSLSNYTTALEQKLSALEQRIAQLEEAIRLKGDEAMRHEEKIAALQAEITALAAAAVVASANEPEVEIELIVEDSQEDIELPNNFETLQFDEAPKAEPVVEAPKAEPVVEAPKAEPVVEAPKAEPVVEAPKAEPVVEAPKAEPVVEAPKAEPAPRAVPQQTSLFGPAVDDIRQAISLGDRFLFQRELFAGNGEMMQKTLDEINSLDSLNEAMEYVLDNFEWDQESTAVKLFENVLKRRFN